MVKTLFLDHFISNLKKAGSFMVKSSGKKDKKKKKSGIWAGIEPLTCASLRSLIQRQVGLWGNFDDPPKSEFLPDRAETYKRHFSVPFSIRIPNFIGIRQVERAVGVSQSAWLGHLEQLWRPTKVGVFTGSGRNLLKAPLWTCLCPYTKFHWDTSNRTGCRSGTKYMNRAFGATTLATHQSPKFHRIVPKPTKFTSRKLALYVYQISFGYDK